MADVVRAAPWPDEPFVVDLDEIEAATLDDLRALATRPVLSVGSVSGDCTGLRLTAAVSVHLLVAGTGARFGRPESWSDLVARRAAVMSGRRVATYLASSRRLVDADRARSWGLVTRIADDPGSSAQTLADAVAGRSRVAVRTIIEQCTRGAASDYALSALTGAHS